MAKRNEIKVTVYRITRRANSVYGNPAYTFHTNNGQYKTSTNAGAVYGLTNDFQVDSSLNNGDGVEVTLITTDAARIIDWKL